MAHVVKKDLNFHKNVLLPDTLGLKSGNSGSREV